MKSDAHAKIAIWCPENEDHGAFHLEDSKFICDSCGKDFTKEIKMIQMMIDDVFGAIGLTNENKKR